MIASLKVVAILLHGVNHVNIYKNHIGGRKDRSYDHRFLYCIQDFFA